MQAGCRDPYPSVKRQNVSNLSSVSSLGMAMARLQQSTGEFLYAAMVEKNPHDTATASQLVRASEAEADSDWAGYQANAALSPAQQQAADTFTALWTQMKASLNVLVFQQAPPPGEPVANSEDAFNVLAAKLGDSVKALPAVQTQHAEQTAAAAAGAYRSARTTIIAAVLAGVLLTLLFGLWVSRLIVSPIAAVSTALDRALRGERADRDKRGADQPARARRARRGR